MPRMELRVVATSEKEVTALRQELEVILSANSDVESYRFNDSTGRGMTGVEIVVSFLVSVAARITSTQLEKFIEQALAKWREAQAQPKGEAPSVEVTPLDE